MESHLNERNNKVRTESCERTSYEVDRFCKPELGWCRYRTNQDGHHFGVWVNMDAKMVAVLSANNFSIIECDSLSDFGSELCHLHELYGEPKMTPRKSLRGKYTLTAHVTFNGQRGVVRDKTFDTDQGWIYLVRFDDREEWLEEDDLEPVWR